jgi:hypothetical protein
MTIDTAVCVSNILFKNLRFDLFGHPQVVQGQKVKGKAVPKLN